VAELHLGDASGLRLIVLLTHLKSQISTENDYKGKDVRTAEAIALAEIYESHRRAYPGTPIVVGGEFNADIASLELELLARTDLVDFHDVIGTPREERATLVHFDWFGIPRPLVLDYLLVSPHLRDRIVRERSFTYRYKGFHDIAERLPASTFERYRMPSDHYPLVLTLSLPPRG
jgi:endonuclease/exonuclease/phosphatase family metal-dependent hydrolase